MALKTGGSSTTTVLNAIQWFSAMNVQDLAAFNALVTSAADGDNSLARPLPTVSQGMIYYGNRGSLKLNEGDWLYIDPTTGWPFVIPDAVVAGGHFVHTP